MYVMGIYNNTGANCPKPGYIVKPVKKFQIFLK
jgi:hypothetical protein